MEQHNILFNTKRLKCFCLILVLSLLVLSPCSDFISVYGRYVGNGSLERMSLASRSILVGWTFVLVVAAYKFSIYSAVRIFIVVVPLISVCTTSLFCYIGTTKDFLETILVVIKLQTFFIFFYAFKTLIVTERSKKVSYYFFDALYSIYCVAIFLGAVLNIEMFHNYNETERFGVKGLIIAGNEASGFLLIGLMWFLLRLEKEKKILPLLFLCIVALILSGTKASFLGLIIILFAYYIYRVGIITGVSRCLSAAVLFTAFATVLYLYNEDIHTAVDLTFAYFKYQYVHVSDESIISLLLSGRDFKLIEAWNRYISKYPQTLMFGGYLVGKYSVEMDIFDMLFLMGLPSLVVYYILWLSCFFKGQAQASRRLRIFVISFIVVWILLANLGGHFFYSAMAAPFAAMLAFYIRTLESNEICR
jgi:hypothetical protein